jgi:hypothetical protein
MKTYLCIIATLIVLFSSAAWAECGCAIFPESSDPLTFSGPDTVLFKGRISKPPYIVDQNTPRENRFAEINVTGLYKYNGYGISIPMSTKITHKSFTCPEFSGATNEEFFFESSDSEINCLHLSQAQKDKLENADKLKDKDIADVLARECEEAGGVFDRWGMSRRKFCNRKTKDGGKACWSGLFCEKSCLATRNTSRIPLVQIGECQKLYALYGCNSFIYFGVGIGGGCSD